MARAPYGSRQKKIPGLEVSLNMDANRIGAQVQSRFQELDEDIKYQFKLLVEDWRPKFFDACRSAIKNSTWLRSRRLYSQLTTRITDIDQGGEHNIKITVSAIVPEGEGENNYAYGLTQEFGRASNVSGEGGDKGGTYMVPLASWVSAKGIGGTGNRKHMTKAQIERDLAQPGVFFPKKVFRTSAGPARMFFVYKSSARPPVTRDKKGRKLTRGQLKKYATAMYLAYKGATGIYGTSGYKRPIRASRSPLASQFALTTTNKAPVWFSRAASNSLGALQRAVNRVKLHYEALDVSYRTGGITGGDGESNFSYGQENIRDFSEDPFEQVSRWYDDEIGDDDR